MIAVIFMLGTVLSAAIATRIAMSAVADRVLMDVPTVLHLYLDESAATAELERENFSLALSVSNYPSTEELSKIGNLSYVSMYDIYLNAFLFSREFERVNPIVDTEGFSDDLIGFLEHELFREGRSDEMVERLPVMGVHNPSLIETEIDKIEMIEGRVFTAEEISSGKMLVVIPSAFAERNGLYIGATMTLESIVHDTLSMESAGILREDPEIRLHWHDSHFYAHHEILEFEVIGVFNVTHQLRYENFLGKTSWEIYTLFRELSNLYNRIYTPFTVAADILRVESMVQHELYGDQSQLMAHIFELRYLRLRANPMPSASFILENRYDLAAFREEANELLPQFWQVNDEVSISSKIALSTTNIMLEIANLILVLAVATMLITLILISTLHLKNIRLSAKKSKLVTQFITKIFLASTLGLGFALFTGYTLSNTITRNMFEQILINQIAENREPISEIGIPFGSTFDPGDLLLEEVLGMYEPLFDVEVVTIFVSVSLAVILIATVVPVVQIVKLKRED